MGHEFRTFLWEPRTVSNRSRSERGPRDPVAQGKHRMAFSRSRSPGDSHPNRLRCDRVMSRQVVYGASSGVTDYAACFFGVGFSALSSSSGSSRLMVM
jgi:hypothetical protein